MAELWETLTIGLILSRSLHRSELLLLASAMTDLHL